jgi:hypothetical protein
MKRMKIARIGGLLLLLGSLLPPSLSLAQIEANLDNYTGQNAEGYLMPLRDGLGAGLNDGVFRTARIPKSGLHVNFEVKTMFVKFSDSDQTFTARTEEGFYPSTEVEAPTVIGSTEAVTVVGQGGAQATLPGGLDMNSLGLAAPQVTIGSIRGTEAILRWTAFNTGNKDAGDLSLFGIGARHSISQYLTDPPVDIAAGVLYQTFKLGDDLIDSSALTLGAMASKQYSVFEPYLGLSYDKFDMTVKYDSSTTNPPTSTKIDFDSYSSMRLTAGLGVGFSIFHLQGEVNFASQTSYLLGLSVGN